MNAAIDLHDSEVQSIELRNGDLRVVLSAAYVHRSSGRPGIDPGTGWLQTAELLFRGVEAPVETMQFSGRVSDGSVSVAGETLSLLPIPLSAAGEVTASFAGANGQVLSFAAASVQCSVYGEPRFVENYPG